MQKYNIWLLTVELMWYINYSLQVKIIHDSHKFYCSFRCIGGFLQFVNGDNLEYHPNEMSLCGANKRYSPPVVQFRDFVQPNQKFVDGSNLDSSGSQTTAADLFNNRGGESNKNKNVALLLFRVDETTTQSQFLAHYSFTPIGDTPEGTSLHIRGGKVRTGNSTFDEEYQYSSGTSIQ